MGHDKKKVSPSAVTLRETTIPLVDVKSILNQIDREVPGLTIRFSSNLNRGNTDHDFLESSVHKCDKRTDRVGEKECSG